MSQELALFNRRIIKDCQALIPWAEMTREGMIHRGRGLGLLMGIIDATTLKNHPSLKREGKTLTEAVSNIVFTGQGCNLHVFCGAEPGAGEDLVARVYVRNELKVAGGGGLSIEVGVESAPPGDGISRHWFWVGTTSIAGASYNKLAQVVVVDDGRVLYSSGDASYDVTKLSERSRLAVLESWGIRGVSCQVLNLACDLRYVGAVMGTMAAHSLGNPYKEQTPDHIWNTFLGVEYEKWRPVVPQEPKLK
jgi:hypothetical protein